jgi:deoxyribonuclease I
VSCCADKQSSELVVRGQTPTWISRVAVISLAFGFLLYQPQIRKSPTKEQLVGRALAAKSAPQIVDSYAIAKRLLYGEVFAGQRETLYCGCRFDAERVPDLAACGYVTRGNPERAGRIEAEHVVPASWIGQTRQCWREPICQGRKGRRFKGRDCCERIDPEYRRAYNDLHNLWPTVGEVNEQRGNYRFGLVPGEPREFGRCDFEVDHAGRRVEPRPEVRGDVARISRYMERTHGVRLSDAHRRLFSIWDRDDPPNDFERERNARIRALQGNGNPFVEDHRRLAAARKR